MFLTGRSMGRSFRGLVSPITSNIHARPSTAVGPRLSSAGAGRASRKRNELPGRIDDLPHSVRVGRLLVTPAAVLADHAAPEADRDRVAGQLEDLPLAAKSIEEGEDRAAADAPPAVRAEHEELRH